MLLPHDSGEAQPRVSCTTLDGGLGAGERVEGRLHLAERVLVEHGLSRRKPFIVRPTNCLKHNSVHKIKLSEVITMEKNTKKGRRSEKELAELMLELVMAGHDEEDIIDGLGITAQKAGALHYRLGKEGKLPYEQLDFTNIHRIVATKRGIFIPRDRFSDWGLDATFSVGTSVRVRKCGNSLAVEPRNICCVQVQKQPVQPEPPLLALEENLLADVIALGESDEPNA